ncbi:hypothetical protein C8Q76DRAFT_262614 [Earliella scabrosa]|nr:hypothetical protein C8Q76DRAFT_262614 [Earliella scabrosa]
MYAKYPNWNASGWWNIDDLVSFLAGSPLLEELYVLGVDIHRSAEARDRVNGQRTVAQPRTVALRRMRRLAFDAHGDSQSIFSAIRRVTSAIIVPPSCHRYYAPLKTSGEDSIAALLESLPGNRHYTWTRLDCSGRNLMQRVGETGSVSLPSVTCTEDWKELLPLPSSSALFARIEELSLCLYKPDYLRLSGRPVCSSWSDESPYSPRICRLPG